MEKQFDCIKLHFTAPLHLSRGREQYDESAKILHSDTLVASLFVAALRLGASEREALVMTDGFRLTSAFPFWQEEFFFPKPMARLPFPMKETPKEKRGKPFKKIRFLGKTWFEKMLHGEENEINEDQHLVRKEFLSDILQTHVFKAEVIQRVTIPPDYTEDAKPFFTERIFFNEDAGLFFLVEWQDEGVKDLFHQSLSVLGDLGIGTDRSVGNGFFTPDFSSLSLRLPDDAQHQCALGLYLPAEQELDETDLEDSAWSLVKRGGYIAGASDLEYTSLRKRSVFMFEEGSVFPDKPLTGNRVDLKPDWEGIHSVWREGRPVFVPIHKTSYDHES